MHRARLTPAQQDRYSRQIRFAPWGLEGQERLAASTAVVVGCGALGTVQASLLARAGVGTLRLVDRDYVEENNLQRQILYTEEDARSGLPKAEAARKHLCAANSGIRIEAFVADLNPGSAVDLLAGAQVILDGSDNFETRFLMNDFAVRDRVPWIYGGAIEGYGIAMAILPGDTACLRCIYPESPAGAQPTCETAGILGPITAMVGAFQCMEALKILSARQSKIRPKIFTADLWNGPVRESEMPGRDADCPACGRHEFTYLDGCSAPVSLCGRNAVQIHDRQRPIDLPALATRLTGIGQVSANEFALRFSDGQHEIMIFRDGRAIVRGTTNVGIARSLYSRYVGN